MAWLRQTAYGKWAVCWREQLAQKPTRSRTFARREDAEVFQREMDLAWPDRPSASSPQSLASRCPVPTRTEPMVPTKQRIAQRIEIDSNGCWRWQAVRGKGGYGRIHLYRSSGKKYDEGAHRASYEAHVGPIPPGLHIDHLCRVRDCVNPEHLEPVTPAENVRRSWRARREAATTA